MKEHSLEKNYGIYAFILGIITGTIVYNFLSIDSSFLFIQKVYINNFFKGYLYLLIHHLKFFLFVFLISFLRLKQPISAMVIFFQAFVMAGAMVVAICNHSGILIYSALLSFIKIVVVWVMVQDKRPIMYRCMSLVILLLGVLITNVLYIYF